MKKTIFFVLIVIILVSVYIFFINKKQVSLKNVSTPTEKVSPVAEQTAEVGKLVNGFPANFILPKDASLIKSETFLNGDKSSRLLIAVYTTNLSLKDISDLYTSFSKSNKFQLVDTTVTTNSIKLNMYTPELTSILIVDLKNKREVMISIVSPIKPIK